ncbi:MAG: polyprenol phosphomannose-dependent alpha 1,6 mannosyltransferase MptB [Candidatus Nanopelagicales bacterium]
MTPSTSFVLRHGLPGLAGTGLIAVGALGVGWLPPSSGMIEAPVVAILHTSLVGSMAARALVIIGLAVLLQAWLVIGYELLSRSRARVATPTADIAKVLALWCTPLLLAPPLFSRDVYSYYVQGLVFAQGRDPTTTGVSVVPGWFDDGADPMWVESPTPYGPLFLAIERGVAEFAQPNAYLGALVFRLAAVLGVALIAWFLPRLARLHGIDPARALWLGVLNPVVLMHLVAGAHNDALMVGLVVTGLALAAERSCAWAAVAVTLGATVKPIALLALPFTGLLWAGRDGSWLDRIRAWLQTALVAAVTLASVFLAVGAGTGVVSAAFGTPSGVLTWLSPTTAIGRPVGLLLTWAGLTADASTALSVVRLLGLAAALVAVAYLVLRPGGRSPVRGAALAFGAVVLLGPVVQPWYLLWFLPLFAATGLSVRELRVAVILTAVFTVHGMIESTVNADNLTDISDTITFVVATGIVFVLLLASPRERMLALGPPGVGGLMPQDEDESSRAEAMRWPAGTRMRR